MENCYVDGKCPICNSDLMTHDFWRNGKLIKRYTECENEECEFNLD